MELLIGTESIDLLLHFRVQFFLNLDYLHISVLFSNELVVYASVIPFVDFLALTKLKVFKGVLNDWVNI
jgi:hypothetical protein